MFPFQIVVEIELILCTLGEPFVFFFALVLFGGWHGWLRIAHGLHLLFFCQSSREKQTDVRGNGWGCGCETYIYIYVSFH